MQGIKIQEMQKEVWATWMHACVICVWYVWITQCCCPGSFWWTEWCWGVCIPETISIHFCCFCEATSCKRPAEENDMHQAQLNLNYRSAVMLMFCIIIVMQASSSEQQQPAKKSCAVNRIWATAEKCGYKRLCGLSVLWKIYIHVVVCVYYVWYPCTVFHAWCSMLLFSRLSGTNGAVGYWCDDGRLNVCSGLTVWLLPSVSNTFTVHACKHTVAFYQLDFWWGKIGACMPSQ